MSARVFISCGQKFGTDEIAIARDLAGMLASRGFSPYVAIEVQNLRSLRENIFAELRDTEFFLFIDFKRERLDDGTYRGSLFAHQELAIASYLDIPLLAFREEGVKALDGVVGILQANAIRFAHRDELVRQVADEITKRQWSPDWRNTLSARLADPPCRRALRMPERVLGRFVHLRVTNGHRSIVARECQLYLKQIVDRRTSAVVPVQTVELKWAGYGQPSATIMPGSSRKADAFWIAETAPSVVLFNSFSDSSHFLPPLVGPGEWQFEYAVISSNLPSAEVTMLVTVGEALSHFSVNGLPCLPPLEDMTGGQATSATTTSSTLLISDVVSRARPKRP